MSQNCTIIKILLHFGPVLCKITSLRTLFGGDILISGEKYVFKHVLLSRKVQKSSWFKILCSFHPFCPIQRVHLAFFWNITCLCLLFGGELLISWEIFVLKHAVLPRKGPKCSWILNIVQFGPILLNSDGLFGHFLEL